MAIKSHTGALTSQDRRGSEPGQLVGLMVLMGYFWLCTAVSSAAGVPENLRAQTTCGGRSVGTVLTDEWILLIPPMC